MVYKQGHKFAATLFYLCITIAATSGCQAAEPITPFQTVIEKSCISGIVPGISGEQEVRTALENCPTLEKESVKRSEGPINSAHFIIYEWTLSPPQHGRINITGGSVSSIFLDVAKGTPLSEFINGLGEPESLSAFYNVYEQCTTSINLDYPSQGISLGIYRIFGCATREGFFLNPETNVTNYYRYIPGMLDDVLKTVFFMSEAGIEGNKLHRQTWNGYGEIRIEP
jgi:hypothetical protein